MIFFPGRINPDLFMKNIIKTAGLAASALAFAGSALAQNDIAGAWKSQFDSQLGAQKYTYEFRVAGTNLTGQTIGISDNGTNQTSITNGTVSANGITFLEPLKFSDYGISIEYTGKLSGDEIKLHCKVGDFAEEDLTVKRVGETGAKPEAKP